MRSGYFVSVLSILAGFIGGILASTLTTQVLANEAASKQLTAHEIILVDEEGRQRISMRSGAIVFRDEQGHVQNILGSDSVHIKKAGKTVGVSVFSDGISMGGTHVTPAIRMSADSDPFIRVAGSKGDEGIEIGINPKSKGGGLAIRDSAGSPRLLALEDMILLINAQGQIRWSAPPPPPIP